MLNARDLPLLVVFASVVRTGSFTAAARALGVSKSVVSEQVRLLEDRLGARLLERTTRRVQITELGTAVFGSAELVERELRELDARLEDDRKAPRGQLRVATTHDLGHQLVAPIAATLALRHPELTIDIVADDAPHDLIAGRFDLALRLGKPSDSSLTARRLLDVPEPIVAAPELASAWAGALRPRDLQGAPWVRHSLVSGPTMRFSGPRGQVDEIGPRVRVQANSGQALRSLLLAGAGLGVLPSAMIADELASGRLRRVCPGWIWKTVTLYALFPSSKHRRRAVEVFVAELRERLQTVKSQWSAA
ncbi:LysR family transcriptional regulator [Nannocystaceae bacterium ST9]